MTTLQLLGFKTTADGLVVVQLDGDTGDAPQKTSMAHIGLQMWSADFNAAVVNHFLIDEKYFCRDSSRWNRADDFSRDQHDPLTIAAGLYGLEWITRRSPWFKYQNKDVAGPMTWSLNIRARKLNSLYPLLYLFDLGLLISVLITIFDKEMDHVDDDNLICRLYQAILIMPTPWSWFARKIYSNYRPKNYGNVYKDEVHPVMGALAWKHRRESGGNEAMVELWRPIILKWFT